MRWRRGMVVALWSVLAGLAGAAMSFAINQIDKNQGYLELISHHPVIATVVCVVFGAGFSHALMRAQARTESPDDPPPPPSLPLPAWTVSRPAEQSAVVAALALESRTPAPVVALRGPGGFGKSTLVDLIAADQQVRKRLKNRIYRVTIGHDADAATVAARVNDLAAMISGQPRGFADPRTAGQHLGGLLDTRPRMLLIVDDVWTEAQLEPFLIGGTGSPRLFTSRIADLGPANCVPVELGTPTAQTSIAILTDGLPGLPLDLAGALCTTVGKWPLLLRMVNRVLAAQIATGADPVAAGKTLLRVRKSGQMAVNAYAAGGANPLVEAVIRAAAPLLPSDGERRLLELAVFAEAAILPVALVGQLWAQTAGYDDLQTRLMCHELGKLSFARVSSDAGGALHLHEVIRDLLRAQLGQAELRELNGRLLDGVAPAGGWWELPVTAAYLWDNVVRHLWWAGRSTAATQLATDPRWLRARLIRSGPPAVLGDLAVTPGAETDRLRRKIARIAHLLEATRPPEAVADILAAHVGIAEENPRLWPAQPLPEPATATARILRGHSGAVVKVVIGPGGNWLASAGQDGTVRIWDPDTGGSRIVLFGLSTIYDLAISPDGLSLAARTARRVYLLDAPSGERARRIDVPGRTLAFTPDGKNLVTSTGSRFWVIEAGSGRTVAAHGERTTETSALAVAGVLAVTANRPAYREHRHFRRPGRGAVAIWRPDGGRKPELMLADHARHVTALAFLDGGRLLVTASQDWTVRTYRTATGECTGIGYGHDGGVLAVAAVDANRFVSGGTDGTVRLWSAGSSVPTATFVGAGAAVGTVAVEPGGTWFALGDRRGDIVLRDLAATDSEDGQPVVLRATARYSNGLPGYYVLTREQIPVAAVPGTPLFAVARANRVRVWSVNGGRRAYELRTPAAVSALAGAPDGSWLAIADLQAEVLFVEPATGTRIGTLRTAGAGKLAVAGNGEWLATAAGNTVEFWRLNDHSPLGTVGERLGYAHAILAAPDGGWLAIADHEIVLIWDVGTATVARRLVRHNGTVLALAVSADGSRLASADATGVVHIWDAVSGRLVTTLRGSDRAINAVLLSPDGKWAVTGGSQRTVRFWDTEHGTLAAELPGHDQPVGGLAWAGDDLLISVSVGKTGIIRRTAGLWGELERRRQPRIREVTAMADGVLVATADGTVARLSGYREGQPSGGPAEHLSGGAEELLLANGGSITAIATDPGQTWLAIGDRDGVATLWDLALDEVRCRFAADVEGVVHRIGAAGDRVLQPSVRPRRWRWSSGGRMPRSIAAVQVAPTGPWVAWAGPGPHLHLWRTDTEHLMTIPVRPPATSYALAVAPDGIWLAIGGSQIELYHPADDTLRTFASGPFDVGALAVSPDGGVLFAADRRTIRSWKMSEPRAVATCIGHTGIVRALAVSPDGSLLASVADNGELLIWRGGEPVATMRIDARLTSCRWQSDDLVVVGGSRGTCAFHAAPAIVHDAGDGN